MARTVYPASGAYGAFNAQTLSAYADWDVEDMLKTFKQESNTRGEIADLVEDLTGKVKMKIRASKANLIPQLQCLVPYLDPILVGGVIFPSADLPFVIQTKDGRSITYYAAAVSKMPDLTLSPKKHLYGDTEFTLLLPQASAVGAASSYVTDAASAYTEPSLSNSDEYFGTFGIGFGAGPLTVIPDKDGISIKPVVDLEPITPGEEPTRNMRIKNVHLEIEFTPLNLTAADFYGTLALLQGNGAAGIGQDIAGGQITIADTAGAGSGGLNLVIPFAGRITGGLRFSNTNSRVNKVVLRAQQKMGATANQSFADGVTNTDTSLVSATAAFVAGDVGKTVTGAGIFAGSTISTVTNGTTVVLSHATTATETGVSFTIVNRTLTGWQPLMIPSVL